MKKLFFFLLMLFASSSLYSQKFQMKGYDALTLLGPFDETPLDSNYAVIDISVSQKERIDVLKTNFIVSKEYKSADKNQMRVVVRIPRIHSNQPLVVTSDNYEDCTIQLTSKLNSQYYKENKPLLYSVRLSAVPIKINHIEYDISKKTTEIDKVKSLKVHNFGTDTSKKVINYFNYVAAYQNDSLDALHINYTAIDINLRREIFDVANADFILKRTYYPGKIRIVIDNNELKQLVVTTKHYKDKRINIPQRSTGSSANGNLKTKSLYNVLLEAPEIENCISIIDITGHNPCSDIKQLEWVPVKGNKQIGINDFHISRYEITNNQWYEVMNYYINSNGRTENDIKRYRTDPNLPKVQVSWEEAMEFCQRFGKKIGKKVSLPTVKQWEYAASGGQYQDSFIYSGGTTLDDVAWYYDNSPETTQCVGTKKPNSLRIYDMTGNVREWCMDDDGKEKKITKGGSVSKDSKNGVDTYLRIKSPNNVFLSTKKTDDASDLGFRVIYEP